MLMSLSGGDSKIPTADERLSKTVLGRVCKELFRKKLGVLRRSMVKRKKKLMR